MIIVQAPLRVSLFGGGTDFPSYFRHEGGCTLSSTIDKYIFVTIKPRFDDRLRVGYTRTELVDDLEEIEHELIREAFRLTGITNGVEVTTMGDIPSEGSGLGSSSTVTVGALHAMYTFGGRLITAERLARDACRIEIDILKQPIGIQDQYIAAYGGLRFSEYAKSGSVCINPLPVGTDDIRRLNDRLLLFYTGMTRQSSTILYEQKENIGDHLSTLREMKDIAFAARDAIVRGELDSVGTLLHESWILKRSLASRISNPDIDALYERARRAGALGGKITGAGGGGFLMLYCPGSAAENVRAALSDLQELPFRFEPDGSKVIFNYRR